MRLTAFAPRHFSSILPQAFYELHEEFVGGRTQSRGNLNAPRLSHRLNLFAAACLAASVFAASAVRAEDLSQNRIPALQGASKDSAKNPSSASAAIDWTGVYMGVSGGGGFSGASSGNAYGTASGSK